MGDVDLEAVGAVHVVDVPAEPPAEHLEDKLADIGREPTLKCRSRSELALKTGHREAMSYTTWHGVLYDHS